MVSHVPRGLAVTFSKHGLCGKVLAGITCGSCSTAGEYVDKQSAGTCWSVVAVVGSTVDIGCTSGTGGWSAVGDEGGVGMGVVW